MNFTTLHLTTEHCEQETDRLLEAAALLYADTAKLEKLRRLAQDYMADMKGLLTNRGLSVPTVGFIGDKNAGKSYLLRMLINDEAVLSKIKSGLGSAGRTEKLTWIGRDLPAELEPEAEAGLRLTAPLQQLALEEDVTLVDIPGFNDSHGLSAQRAEDLALKSCQIKVLVAGYGEREAERFKDHAKKAPGPIIVPVLNLARNHPASPEAKDAASQYELSIRSAVSAGDGRAESVVVRPAVIVPDADCSIEDFEQARPRFIQAIREAVEELRRQPGLEQKSAKMRRERFYEAVRRDLEDDYQHIRELLERINAADRKIPHELLPHLIGSERVAAAGLRIWLRTEVLHRTPSYFFPLRSFLGVLALTSRAWDSLILAMGGSVPSLFTTLFKVAGSVRLLRSRRDQGEDAALEAVMRSIALEKQYENLQALRRKLDTLSAAATHAAPVVPKPQIAGLLELRASAQRSFEEIIRAHALPRWPVNLLGWASLAWCGVLLYGPLRAVYGHHLTTLWRSVHEGAALSWQDFPVPPFSTVMGWILLAFLPVFVVALFVQSLAATQARVRACHEEMTLAIERALDDLAQKGILTVKVRDAKLDAAQHLFGEVSAKGARPSD